MKNRFRTCLRLRRLLCSRRDLSHIGWIERFKAMKVHWRKAEMEAFRFCRKAGEQWKRLTRHKKRLCRMETQMKDECKGNKLPHERWKGPARKTKNHTIKLKDGIWWKLKKSFAAFTATNFHNRDMPNSTMTVPRKNLCPVGKNDRGFGVNLNFSVC